jgi:hypothetical protein
MNLKRKLTAVFFTGLVFLVWTLARPTAASTAGAEAGALFRAGSEARALALGGPGLMLRGASEAVLYNPAALATESAIEFSASLGLQPGAAEHSQLSLILPLTALAYEDSATAALGGIGFFILRRSTSHAIEARSNDTPNPDYFFGDQETGYGLGYGVALYPWWEVGVSFHGLAHQLGPESSAGWGLVPAMGFRPWENLYASLAVVHAYSWESWSTKHVEHWPQIIKSGLAFRVFKIGAQALECFGQLDYFPMWKIPTYHLGLEYRWDPWLALRLGYHDEKWALGAGIGIPIMLFNKNILHFDYAFKPDAIYDYDHYVTIKLKLLL